MQHALQKRTWRCLRQWAYQQHAAYRNGLCDAGLQTRQGGLQMTTRRCSPASSLSTSPAPCRRSRSPTPKCRSGQQKRKSNKEAKKLSDLDNNVEILAAAVQTNQAEIEALRRLCSDEVDENDTETALQDAIQCSQDEIIKLREKLGSPKGPQRRQMQDSTNIVQPQRGNSKVHSSRADRDVSPSRRSETRQVRQEMERYNSKTSALKDPVPGAVHSAPSSSSVMSVPILNSSPHPMPQLGGSTTRAIPGLIAKSRTKKESSMTQVGAKGMSSAARVLQSRGWLSAANTFDTTAVLDDDFPPIDGMVYM